MGGGRDVYFVSRSSDFEPELVSESVPGKVSAGTYPDAGCKCSDACINGNFDVQRNHHVRERVCISPGEGKYGCGKDAPPVGCLLGIFVHEPASWASLGDDME